MLRGHRWPADGAAPPVEAAEENSAAESGNGAGTRQYVCAGGAAFLPRHTAPARPADGVPRARFTS
ncbi:hypothetical protein GCM10009802_13950 [Streptomyces synnematoformans]|uniref:Uncharacterized protein n=1 Tax=Streptomyces synnematoformans TaxID=415721 RepID=A0ABN2XPU1_9ACTN